jgi:CBS domain-containing protein
MEFNEQFFGKPDLEAAVDRHPVLLTPEMPLAEAIALMSQARGSSCLLAEEKTSLELFSQDKVRSNCGLVLDKQQLLGILTERDIVRLTAAAINFAAVKVAEVMTQPVITLAETNFKDIFAALFLFRRYRIRHLPLVDADNNLVGVISPETIRQAMRPANLLKLRRVVDVMSKQIVHASLNASVLNVAQIMAKHRVSCVVITEKNKEEDILMPVGIITERDILQFQYLQLKLEKIAVQEVMSTPLFLLSPEDSLLTAHQEMQRRRVRRLVVSWNWGRGLGIVTQTNLLRIFDPIEMYGVIETLQHTVQQLEQEKAELLEIVEQKIEVI